MRVDRQVDPHVLRFLNGRNGFPVGRRAVGLDRLADQPHIQVESDTRDVTGLLGAEHVSCAADFKIFHRHRHACAELVVLRDGGQPVIRRLGERNLRRIQEIRVAPLATASHSAAQLM